MIKKMTKYSFVVFHTDTAQFLSNLQELGVVDVTRSKKAIDNYSQERFEEFSEYNKMIKHLNEIAKKENETDTQKLKTLHPAVIEELNSGTSILVAYQNRAQKSEELNRALLELNNAIKLAEPWGDFNADNIEQIKSLGYKPHFYVVPESKFNDQWEKEYPITILNKIDGKIYLIVLETASEPYTFKGVEVKFPDISYLILEEKKGELLEKIQNNSTELQSIATELDNIIKIKENILNDLDIYLAHNKAQKEAEETIDIFEAFAPTELDSKVEEYLKDNSVYYFKDAAKQEDNPPIKLKNNFFAKLFEPIGEMYMLPKYGEVDMTIFFAPFYMLFFGLCLGDMGYGLILMIVGLIATFRLPKFANYGKLITWLGLGALIMPALNGTVFGAKIYEIIPMPENITNLFFSDIKLFWFSIIFGLVQIVFARLLNAIIMMKNKGFTYGLSNIGWSILIVWGSVYYASGEAGFQYPTWLNYIGYAGLALILFFSNNHKNIFVRVIKGALSLYDVTGLFGDMLSYIRLFGLGLAGGVLGLVVNSIAFTMSGIPYVGWGVTIIVLIFGHTAVLMLNMLGALVHPMRLTFVEFYKNVGFEGGGRAYSPLKKEK